MYWFTLFMKYNYDLPIKNYNAGWRHCKRGSD